MARQQLAAADMVRLSAPWTDRKGAVRKLLEAIPEVGFLLPRVDRAHQTLERYMAPPPDPELARLAAEAAETDLRFDALVRGTHMLLTGLSSLLDDGTALLTLRDALLPDGLALTQRTYGEEAGEARRLETRLDARARKELKALPVGKKDLCAIVEEIVALGKRLGEIEDERARRTQAPADRVDLLKARNEWVKTAGALAGLIELLGIDAAKETQILGPLRQAEKAAEQRSARKKGKPSSEQPPAAPAPGGASA